MNLTLKLSFTEPEFNVVRRAEQKARSLGAELGVIHIYTYTQFLPMEEIYLHFASLTPSESSYLRLWYVWTPPSPASSSSNSWHLF